MSLNDRTKTEILERYRVGEQQNEILRDHVAALEAEVKVLTKELSCGVPIPPKRAERPNTRYRIVSDDSGHKYYIPVEHDADWETFMAIPEDDERSWDVPSWAERIDGRFTFTDPRCE